MSGKLVYLDAVYQAYDERYEYGLDIDDVLFDIPTIEIVRCKDCKHWEPMNNGSWMNKHRTDGRCSMLLDIHYSERYMTAGDHFCSYGERRKIK